MDLASFFDFGLLLLSFFLFTLHCKSSVVFMFSEKNQKQYWLQFSSLASLAGLKLL